jgi:hypothetical protein
MTRTKIRLLPIAFAALAGIGCLFASDRITTVGSASLITEAHAIIGRPLTPLSYAGVARRTTRRAVAYGAYGGMAVAPVVVAPIVVGPVCTQVVNAYGQIAMVCR